MSHNVKSGKVIIKDAKTIFIPKFSYDGKARAVFYVGNGTSRKNPETKIPDEKGR
jgi:Electron transfer DM13